MRIFPPEAQVVENMAVDIGAVCDETVVLSASFDGDLGLFEFAQGLVQLGLGALAAPAFAERFEDAVSVRIPS
ncbi:hypothetical protein [Nocardiopsis potens]|uniref:hypothetical protein n=1 Tax=Nocardiopsis potens TaxID=1246458 RepID=UPI0003657ABF|nr:hypothetical protein [Nocardiopsis potens]